MVFEARSDISAVEITDVLGALRGGSALQIHCDGGFDGQSGAYAFVVHEHRPRSAGIYRLGYKGFHILSARSAFQAEVNALAAAIVWLREISAGMHVFRRVRFDAV